MLSPRELTRELLASAAGLLAEAFFDNPAHLYICPDPRRRMAQLEWLLGTNLRLQPDLRASFCLVDGGVVNAMGFWTRPTAPRIGILPRIRAGVLAVPFHLGLEGARRLRHVTREIDRHLGDALGGEPFWYLNNMVVRESLRGSGIGTRLLREELRKMAETDPVSAVALSTQRSENVIFYRRLGFHVARDHVVGEGPQAFRNWIMVRPPAQRPRGASTSLPPRGSS